eukprot:COSAG01_NODE_725_length_14049_cov_7.712760_9_plen_105_part_00
MCFPETRLAWAFERAGFLVLGARWLFGNQGRHGQDFGPRPCPFGGKSGFLPGRRPRIVGPADAHLHDLRHSTDRGRQSTGASQLAESDSQSFVFSPCFMRKKYT